MGSGASKTAAESPAPRRKSVIKPTQPKNVNAVATSSNQHEHGDTRTWITSEKYDSFPQLSDHENCMAQTLTPAVYEKLKRRPSKTGYTVDLAIQPGVDHSGTEDTPGCVAGEEESYTRFAELFNPVIARIHHGFNPTDHHTTDLRHSALYGGNLDSKYVLNCRIKTRRNIRGYPLSSHCSRAGRRLVEMIVVDTIYKMKETLFKGKYRRVTWMTKHDQAVMRQRFSYHRDWPDARGIWYNNAKNLVVWTHKEEHCLLVSMGKTSNIKSVFQRFCDAVMRFEDALLQRGFQFMWCRRLGYITSNPAYLGTGLDVNVMVKLPNLSQNPNFNEIVEALQLKFTKGSDETTFDFENTAPRLGNSELEIVQMVVDGIRKLIEVEKRMENDLSIERILPLRNALDDFPDLTHHYSVMARCLTRVTFDSLKDKVTPNGFTLNRVIKPGTDNPGSPHVRSVGCVAGDEESYEVFADLFDPVIERIHDGYAANRKHPTDMNHLDLCGGDDLDTDIVLSCRLRTARSIRGFCLPPRASRRDRRAVERHVKEALKTLHGQFFGTYYPYPLNRSTDRQLRLLLDEEKISVDKPNDPDMISADMAHEWPDARGVWFNNVKNIVVIVNQRDHCRFIVVEEKGKLATAFRHLCKTIASVEDSLRKSGKEFMRNDHLGYIVTCPSDLGTGLKISINMRLSHICKHPFFYFILEKLHLRVQSIHGGKDDSHVYELTNAKRLGMSEVETLQWLVDGVKTVADMETALLHGRSIDVLLPEGVEPLSNVKLIRRGAMHSVDNYPRVYGNYNWMSRCLSREIYSRLHRKKTRNGVTLDVCIQPGVDIVGSPRACGVGLVAGDEASYSVFSEIFDPVIEKVHKGYARDMIHPTDVDYRKITDGHLEDRYVVRCYIQTRRSVRPFRLPPCCDRAERREVERIIVQALETLSGEYEGKYYPLPGIQNPEEHDLKIDTFMFNKPDNPKLVSSGVTRDWPDGRGVWYSKNKDLIVWINQVDHIRLTSTREDGNMYDVFRRFTALVRQIERGIIHEKCSFMWNRHHGYINTSPLNIGTALRAGVYVKLPKLAKLAVFDELMKKLELKNRFSTTSNRDILYIRILHRLGFSEVKQVQVLINRVRKLIEMEKRLEIGGDLHELLPTAPDPEFDLVMDRHEAWDFDMEEDEEEDEESAKDDQLGEGKPGEPIRKGRRYRSGSEYAPDPTSEHILETVDVYQSTGNLPRGSLFNIYYMPHDQRRQSVAQDDDDVNNSAGTDRPHDSERVEEDDPEHAGSLLPESVLDTSQSTAEELGLER